MVWTIHGERNSTTTSETLILVVHHLAMTNDRGDVHGSTINHDNYITMDDPYLDMLIDNDDGCFSDPIGMLSSLRQCSAASTRAPTCYTGHLGSTEIKRAAKEAMYKGCPMKFMVLHFDL